MSWEHPDIPNGIQKDPRVAYYNLEFQLDGDGWLALGSTMQPSYEWRGVRPGTYDFRVCCVGLGAGGWQINNDNVVGDPGNPIPTVTGLALKTSRTSFYES